VPTVYREDYMGALRLLTRREDPAPFIRMMLRLDAFSATVFGDDIKQMEAYLRSCNAFMVPQVGKLKFELPNQP